MSRLSKALKAAKAPKRKYHFTHKTASAIRRKWLAEQKFVPTRTMRIHEDAITLARSAWPKCNDRVKKCSEAIREKARKELGM